MRIVRTDVVGTVTIKLLKRPTNTCVGVNNFHLYAEGALEPIPAPVVRFLGTDPWEATCAYQNALEAAQTAFKVIPVC